VFWIIFECSLAPIKINKIAIEAGESKMQYRPLGKSQIEASIIGLGTHAFGGSLDSKTANWESRGPTGKLDVDRIIKLQTIF
tara:strand:- start:42 stop:287 length:246 start_codon:yes stop_codon:yes gene_type:complete